MSTVTEREGAETANLEFEPSEFLPALRESSQPEERRKRLVNAMAKLSP
jgi:hypothetical protein